MKITLDIEKQRCYVEIAEKAPDGNPISTSFEFDDGWTVEGLISRAYDEISEEALNVYSPYM